MKKIFSFIFPVLLGFALGFIAGRLQESAIQEWYPYLNKPSLTPPNSVFPIAWSIIYFLSGISFGLVYNSTSINRNKVLLFWGIQLIFNFLWSILFFYFRNPLLGMIDILILDIVVILYIIKSYSQNRMASILYWPYILWLCFATYLNIYILLYN